MEFIVLTETLSYQLNINNIIKSIRKTKDGKPVLRKDLINKISDTALRAELDKITEIVTEKDLYIDEVII